CQCGLVLDAVKAGLAAPASAAPGGTTASLDRVSTRGQTQIMGRDEETGFFGRTKKQATSSRFFVRPQAVSSSRPAKAMTPRADAVKAGRRAAAPYAVLSPGHALTAASTASSWPRSGFTTFCELRAKSHGFMEANASAHQDRPTTHLVWPSGPNCLR